jgi:hypothetical protein
VVLPITPAAMLEPYSFQVLPTFEENLRLAFFKKNRESKMFADFRMPL